MLPLRNVMSICASRALERSTKIGGGDLVGREI